MSYDRSQFQMQAICDSCGTRAPIAGERDLARDWSAARTVGPDTVGPWFHRCVLCTRQEQAS